MRTSAVQRWKPLCVPGTKICDSSESTVAPLGGVFTPRNWADWLVTRYDLVETWLAGATVLDPTCGDGALLLALAAGALRRGVQPEALPVQRLYGVERESTAVAALLARFRREIGTTPPRANIRTADLLLTTPAFCAHVILI